MTNFTRIVLVVAAFIMLGGCVATPFSINPISFEQAKHIDLVAAEFVDLHDYENLLGEDFSTVHEPIPVVKVTFRSDTGLIDLALQHNVDYAMEQMVICDSDVHEGKDFTPGGVFSEDGTAFSQSQRLAKLNHDSHIYFVFVDLNPVVRGKKCSFGYDNDSEHLQSIEITLFGGDRAFIEQSFQSNTLVIPTSSINRRSTTCSG